MTVMWPICALAIALPLGAASQTVSIPAIADAGLREVFPTTPGGAETGFRVGNTGLGGGESRNRALVRFDVPGTVPPGAEITEVSLRLTMERTTDSVTRAYELRRVLVSWEELQVSWNQRSAALAWALPGGLEGADFSLTASAAAQVGGIGSYVWGSTPGMVADARRWQSNAAENFGWMLLINPEGVAGTARKFYSRENSTDSPMLDVTYRPPFRINSVAVSGASFCMSFTAAIGRSYVVECRDDIARGSWLMLTNLPPAKLMEQVTICDTLGALQRYYRVAELTPPVQ